ncbi:MAG: HAD family hydrolase [Anaerolineae bacterium]
MGCGPDLRDIEAVLFDFDGTLVHLNIDFGRMRAEVKALLPQYGLSMEGRSTLYVLELIEDAVRELKAQDEGRARAFQQEAEAAIVAIEMEAADQAQVYPEVPRLLRRLRERGIKVAIVTRNCGVAVDRILAENPLVYDVLLTRDEVTAVKPNPEHLLAALRLLGVEPQQTLMVGDHPMDVQVGRAVGARTAAVLTGAGSPERFSEVQPDLILAQVGDLSEYLT